MAAPLTGYFPSTGDRIVDGMTNEYYRKLDSTKFVNYFISNGFQGQYWFKPCMVALYMSLVLPVAKWQLVLKLVEPTMGYSK